MGTVKMFYRIKKVHGNYYLYKEWYDPETKKRHSISLGNCEKIERILRSLAPGAGFEPARGPCPTGSQGPLTNKNSRRVYHNNVAAENKAKSGKFIALPPREKFEEWLRKQVSENTLKAYIQYYFAKLPRIINLEDLPKIIRNKWVRNLLNKIAEYLWEIGELSFEDKERVKALIKRSFKKSGKRKVRSEIADIKSFLETMEYLKKNDPYYYFTYKIMYYSGARLQEAVYIIANINNFHRELPQKEFEAIGYVDLGNAVRLNVHYDRGRKRCSHLWLPKQLFQEIRPLEVSSRAVSYYARDHNLMQPKLVRKLHYQILEDLIEDISLRNFMQSRYSKLTIGDTNYSKLVLRADKAYAEKVLPKLRGILNE